MRLHRLAATAFGPFPGRVEVDFDELTDAGLFLIHGPTGAGKTSLLDAICFALYADLPGARGRRGLRSDHAAPDAVPSVELELTASGRRLRVRRSPEYERPKKRGTGTVRVQASVVLEERVGGSWLARGTRHDEVADIVLDVLGMGLAQFAKVVLLPQGDFAAFLRASAEDRRAVLERLFDIGRFADVEAWLADQRRLAGAAVAETEAALATDLARLGDVLADQQAVPAHDWVALPATELAERLAETEAALQEALTLAVTELDAASTLERAAAAAHAAGVRRARLRLRARGLRERLGVLEGRQEANAEELRRLDGATRAASLAGHLAALRRAVDDERGRAGAVDAARQAVSRLALEDRSAAGVVLVLDRVQAMDRLVDDLARFADSLDDLEARAGRARADREALAEELADVESAAAAAAAAHEAAGARADELRERAGHAGRLADARDRAAERVGLARRRDALEAGAAEARRALADSRDVAQDARQRALDLQQRRIEGMAGELAASLEDGAACPVCGSAEHPAPATAGDPVTPAQVRAAHEEAAGCAAAHHEAELALAATETSLRGIRDRLPGSPTVADLDADLDAAESELGRAQEAADALAAAEDALGAAAAARAMAAERTAAIALERVRLETVIAELAGEAETLATAVARAVADHAERCPCDPGRRPRHTTAAPERSALTALADTHARTGRHLADLVTSLQTLTDAGTLVARARQAVDGALAEAGFADLAEAQAATMPAAEVAALAARCEAHDRELVAARTALADPELAEAEAAGPVDVPALAEAERGAKAALLQAQAAQTRALAGLRGVQRLRPAIDERCAALGPSLERYARLKDLADAVGGTGGENTLRMRLTSFVLAARLEKVADLANERLAIMGAGRYRLEHTDERASRGARSGLGLRVLDQWTGRTRDTSTLSGGEAFMASLALALGLADAVREESGGLDLRTLVIDEGFGSLDDESLEQVLDVLDGLREGGRAVGVVSHVAELRARIPSQVVVHKDTAGSTVTVATTAATPAA